MCVLIYVSMYEKEKKQGDKGVKCRFWKITLSLVKLWWFCQN